MGMLICFTLEFWSAASRPKPFAMLRGSFAARRLESFARWQVLLRRFAQDDTFYLLLSLYFFF
jgi:hypothetical protein